MAERFSSSHGHQNHDRVGYAEPDDGGWTLRHVVHRASRVTGYADMLADPA
jgi:hypothetical protein